MGGEKKTIALIFEGNVQDGGGFQEQFSKILTLPILKKYNYVVFVNEKNTKAYLDSYKINTVILKKSTFDKLVSFVAKINKVLKFFVKRRIEISFFEKILTSYKVDLVYFLSPSSRSMLLLKHSYIMTVWDLCHCDMPEFPEVTFLKEFENRENFYKSSLNKAIAVLVDSDIGKRNVVNRYRVHPDRVHIIPFLPSVNVSKKYNIDIRKKYQIEGEYIYYPAQFWAHKNHIYIIDALKMLIDEGIKLTAVFSGSDKGNLQYVLKYAEHNKITTSIKYIGFAPSDEIFSLYKQALALVMPSYFGPTNIPPLEAFAIGTPVIYSDIPSFREQVKDAALFCDLKNPQSLVDNLKKISNSIELRNNLVVKGKKMLEIINKQANDSCLEKILNDYFIKQKCWKN